MTGTEQTHRGLQVVYTFHIADMVMNMVYTKYIPGIYYYMIIYLVYTRYILPINCVYTMYIQAYVHICCTVPVILHLACLTLQYIPVICLV